VADEQISKDQKERPRSLAPSLPTGALKEAMRGIFGIKEFTELSIAGYSLLLGMALNVLIFAIWGGISGVAAFFKAEPPNFLWTLVPISIVTFLALLGFVFGLIVHLVDNKRDRPPLPSDQGVADTAKLDLARKAHMMIGLSLTCLQGTEERLESLGNMRKGYSDDSSLGTKKIDVLRSDFKRLLKEVERYERELLKSVKACKTFLEQAAAPLDPKVPEKSPAKTDAPATTGAVSVSGPIGKDGK
jgi:hypothetical protein